MQSLNCVMNKVVLIHFLRLLVKLTYIFMSLANNCVVNNSHFHLTLYIALIFYINLVLVLSPRV